MTYSSKPIFELSRFSQNWEQEILQFACSLARRLAEEIFKEMDDALKEEGALGTKIVGFREKRVISFLVMSNSGEGYLSSMW